MKNKQGKSDQTPSAQSRRELLKSISAALVASSVSGLSALDADAQVKGRQPKVVTIPETIKTALQNVTPNPEGKEFSVFFSHPRGARLASVVAVPASDQEAVNALSKELGGSAAKAMISGGIIHVNLGVAAEGRCTLSRNAGVASFKPDPGPVEIGVIRR